MTTPTAILVTVEEEPLRVAAFFSGTLPFALEVEELLFFSGGVAIGSAAGALRLRNSTIVNIGNADIWKGCGREFVVKKGLENLCKNALMLEEGKIDVLHEAQRADHAS